VSIFTPPNFVKYLEDVVNTYDEAYPHLRWGQTYFNVLCKYAPNLALNLQGTDLDPFCSDHKIPQFIEHVKERWSMYD
jgi:hypothetical protein